MTLSESPNHLAADAGEDDDPLRHVRARLHAQLQASARAAVRGDACGWARVATLSLHYTRAPPRSSSARPTAPNFAWLAGLPRLRAFTFAYRGGRAAYAVVELPPARTPLARLRTLRLRRAELATPSATTLAECCPRLAHLEAPAGYAATKLEALPRLETLHVNARPSAGPMAALDALLLTSRGAPRFPRLRRLYGFQPAAVAVHEECAALRPALWALLRPASRLVVCGGKGASGDGEDDDRVFGRWRLWH